jgi:hypothetical protein
MHEDLDEDDVIVALLRLKLIDFIISPLPLGICAKALDAFNEYPAIPGPVKDVNFAFAGQPVPEAPKEMADTFLI